MKFNQSSACLKDYAWYFLIFISLVRSCFILDILKLVISYTIIHKLKVYSLNQKMIYLKRYIFSNLRIFRKIIEILSIFLFEKERNANVINGMLLSF